MTRFGRSPRGRGTSRCSLVAGYLGFGALAASHGISVAVASTALAWALPGQLWPIKNLGIP